MPCVDVMRGIAMLLVILSHAAALVDGRTVPGLPYLLLIRITNLASVAFVFVSGTIVNYFLESRPDRATVVKRFARRAVFLLAVTHPAVWFASWFLLPGQLSAMLDQFYSTDTIAICLLVGPPLMMGLGSRAKIAAVPVLLGSAVVLKAFWLPTGPAQTLLKEVLVGQSVSAWHPVLLYPVLPWLGVFLAGSVLGASLAAAAADSGLRALGSRVQRAGTTLVLTGVSATAVYKVARAVRADLWSPAFLEAVHPDRTTILFPLYVGVLLWIFAWLIRCSQRPQGFGRAAWFVSVLGRTSLFAFVVQFAIVWSLPAVLGWRNRVTLVTLWPMFAASVATVWAASYAYGRLTNRIASDDLETFSATAVEEGPRLVRESWPRPVSD
jgi:uncharacterized membrane protein